MPTDLLLPARARLVLLLTMTMTMTMISAPTILPDLYRLWIGGGTIPLTERYRSEMYTADEVRHLSVFRHVPCSSEEDELHMRSSIESALSTGSGHGSCGYFGHGSAAGSSVVIWRIERCIDPGRLEIAHRYRDARGLRAANELAEYAESPHQRALREIADADRQWRSR